jgi:hypothetical protein
MHRFVALLLLVGLAGPAFAQSAKYASKEGKFRIQFPAGKPETSERTSDSPTGPLKFKMVTWSSADGNQAVIVSFVDYVLETGQTFDQEKGLDGGVEGALKKTGTERIGFVGKIEFGKDKLPGRTFDMKRSNPTLYFKNLMIMKETRMYHVIVVGDEEFALGKPGREMVNSFELVK